MYRPTDTSQHSFLDFDQPMGLRMDPGNRWVRLADIIPWDMFEERYAALFPSNTGNVAKPLRMALGALIIQAKFQFSDRELVEQLTENPYLQYFIGLHGYQQEAPFDASTLVDFRKRITAEMLMEANEYMLEHKDDGRRGGGGTPPSGGSAPKKGSKEGQGVERDQGTLTVDATCAPVNIRYPQDVSLLNEAREKLEAIISRFCKAYGLALPRRYARTARKEYLKFAKAKKSSRKKIRRALRKQLSYVARDLGYLDGFMARGYAPVRKDAGLIMTIAGLYGQQKYMYDNKTHSVEHRIVSLRQPWVRPIVRGKVRTPVEFGPKFDLSLDGEGYARIGRISFEAYNESCCLQMAVEHYRERTGHYPGRVLADRIYRTRENRRYCKERGIRLSGPKLGRPGKTVKEDREQEYRDNTDRIEVERSFSLGKRCYGMGLIMTKLEGTQLASVALSVFVMNLFKIHHRILSVLSYIYSYYMVRSDGLIPERA